MAESRAVERVDPVGAWVDRMTEASWSGVALRSEGPRAQVALRVGTSGRPAVEARLGTTLPAPNRVASCRWGEVLGLGPDEWLVVGEDGQAGAIEAELRDALGGWGAAVDVSDSRVGVRLSGPAAREVLASCVALDFHPTRFQPGHCAQTLLGKVPVLVQQLDEAPTYCLRSRPSMAAYLVDWLVDGVIGTRLDR